jgi:hypothetical protein
MSHPEPGLAAVGAGLAQEELDHLARGGRIGVQRGIAAVVEPAFAERDDAVGEDLRLRGRVVPMGPLPLDDVAHGGDEAWTDTAGGRGHDAEAVVAFVGEEGVQRVVVRESAQEVAGEPILNYDYPHVTVTNNVTGAPQWSPDGTMIALNTNFTKQPYVPEAGRNAPFLLVARLMAQKPTRPLRTVSSDVGSWAPTPTQYHGALGFKGTVVLHGPGGGTVTVSYGGVPGPGVLLGGQWSESYRHYSDNGSDFVNGTVTITGLTAGTYSAHLTMTGRHTGSQDTELTFEHLSVSGDSTSTLDGHSISGPKPDMVNGGSCPRLLPKKPALRVTATRRGDGVYRLKVTASIADMGANEAAVDTEPVNRATIKLGTRTTHTNAHGIAVVKVHGNRKVTVTAGDTLKPTSVSLTGR